MEHVFNKKADISVLIETLRRYFQKDDFDARVISDEILVLEKQGLARKLFGLSSGLRVSFTSKRDQTHVKISGYQEEYIIKVVSMIILIFVPIVGFVLIALPAFGIYKQYKLVKRVLDEIDDYFNHLIPDL